jgi:hypothetical protein
MEMNTPLSDREEFNSFVYLQLGEALDELNKRHNDKKLEAYVKKMLPGGIPEIMLGKKNIAIFRNLATPNFEIHRFAQVADALPEFNPIIFEYLDDKYVRVNEAKRLLGEPRFYKGMNANMQPTFEKMEIVGFNESNGHKISSLITHWGEKLVDAHHRSLIHRFPNLKNSLFDLSDWLQKIAPNAKQYYKSFFLLFLRDGILLENYLPGGKELAFTRDVILPALREIKKESGYKPLIVALEPTDIEGDMFWLAHPPQLKEVFDHKGKK